MGIAHPLTTPSIEPGKPGKRAFTRALRMVLGIIIVLLGIGYAVMTHKMAASRNPPSQNQ